jgi:flagellar motor switch/type III secretory pathway protein FliN
VTVARKVLPWRPLASCRRVDAEAHVAIRHACEANVSLPHAARALGELVGAKVEVRLQGVKRDRVPESLDGGIAVDLMVRDGHPNGILLEVEGALAVNLTSRAIKRPAPRLVGAAGGDDAAALAGGLAALVTAASRPHASFGPLQVRAAGTSAALLGAARSSARAMDVATFDVSVDHEAYTARLIVSPLAANAGPGRWDKNALSGLGALPLDLPIVAATTQATAAEIASLEVGDAWMLGPADWAKTLRGDVVLAAPGAQIGARAALVEGGVLVLRAGQKELWQDPMPNEGNNDPIVEAVGDVPIIVRVEVGAARMTAREWADVGVGDVIGLAHKLAEPVTLRVGGAEVAKGELVDIEGEIGVRILSRHGAGRGT